MSFTVAEEQSALAWAIAGKDVQLLESPASLQEPWDHLWSCGLVSDISVMMATAAKQDRLDPLEEGGATHPVFFPGESHGQRTLAGYSP